MIKPKTSPAGRVARQGLEENRMVQSPDANGVVPHDSPRTSRPETQVALRNRWRRRRLFRKAVDRACVILSILGAALALVCFVVFRSRLGTTRVNPQVLTPEMIVREANP